MHKGDYKRIIDQGYKVCCKLVDPWHMVGQIKGKSSHAKWLMASVDFAKEMCKKFFSPFQEYFLCRNSMLAFKN